MDDAGADGHALVEDLERCELACSQEVLCDETPTESACGRRVASAMIAAPDSRDPIAEAPTAAADRVLNDAPNAMPASISSQDAR